MAKPVSKKTLLESCQINYEELMALVHSFSKEEIDKEFPEGTLNRNVRDVLAHLHHWHVMMMDWYKVGMKGDKPDMPAKGYTWKTLPDLNRKIWGEYKNTDLKTVMSLLDTSYADVQEIINNHTSEELFEKKRYPWTGSTSLGAYLISNTSSHYDWGMKRIKKSMK